MVSTTFDARVTFIIDMGQSKLHKASSALRLHGELWCRGLKSREPRAGASGVYAQHGEPYRSLAANWQLPLPESPGLPTATNTGVLENGPPTHTSSLRDIQRLTFVRLVESDHMDTEDAQVSTPLQISAGHRIG